MPKSVKIIAVSSVFVIFFGAGLSIINQEINLFSVTAEDLMLQEQEATIRAIEQVSPAVVSIRVVAEEDVLLLETGNSGSQVVTDKIEKANGTGFIFTPDGYILTNKHVIEAAESVERSEYKVILGSGKEYYAQFIGKDPLKDLAVIKIFDKDLPHVRIGNSNELKVGSSVIAIGNSLGKYPNSATKGIVSGLGRYIYANNDGKWEDLDNVIQTDAEINLGNSGGPLINLRGEVVGVNVAVDEGGTAIGFAIPMVDVEPVIRTIKTIGRIVRPYIGVYYMTLDPLIADANDLPRTSGAWLTSGEEDRTVIFPDSPAAKAGLEEGDIIFEVNAVEVNEVDTLLSIVQRYKPGDRIGLKIQRGEKVIIRELTLEEFRP